MENTPDGEPEVLIEAPDGLLSEDVEENLRADLELCPDIAFAHLCTVQVTGEPGPQPSLFVWLVPAAVGSHRAALNLVAETVAGALPEDVFLDVLILNSVPELLARVEDGGRLLVERDADEHRRAREALE